MPNNAYAHGSIRQLFGLNEGVDPMNERIEEIRKALEAATPGPWNREGKEIWRRGTSYAGDDPHIYIGEMKNYANGDVAANSPEWLRYLLSVVEQQQAEIERKDKFVAEWISGEDKFNEFGGWERIEAMQKELQQSREENERLRGELETAKVGRSNERILKEEAIRQGNELEVERDIYKSDYGTAQIKNAELESEVERLLGDMRRWKTLCLERDGRIAKILAELEQVKAEFARHRTFKSLEEWHEDHGAVLWWNLPIVEPPYVGTPLDSDWPDYHTHWTPLIDPFILSRYKERGDKVDG